MRSVFAEDRLEKALRIACQEHAGATALRSDENVLYRELWELSGDTQARLAGNGGIEPDEPILVETRNQPLTVALFAGVWFAGGVVVPVHHSSTRDNLNSLVKRTGARRMLTSNGDIVSLAEAAPARRPLLQEAAFVIFTSGSTGQPKGVVLGHKALIGKMEAINQILRFSAHTAMLVPLQLNFIFGIWATLLPLLVGGSVRLLDKFDPTDVAALPARDELTDLVLVPTMLRRLLGQPGLRPVPLRAISGGEPLSDGVARSVGEKWASSGVVDAYGLTETCGCDFFLLPHQRAKLPGSIGFVSPGVEYRIAGENSERQGELEIRSRFAMNGYFDDPQTTASSYSDGFFKTGDLVRRDPDAALRVVGRNTQMINRGGNKISPMEIENAAMRVDGVGEALCTSVRDVEGAEFIVLVVVPRRGALPAADRIREALRQTLEKYKQPDRIEVVATLPVGSTGKVDRNSLRRLFSDSDV